MKYLAILVFAIILGSCGIKVHTVQDSDTDFSKFKTFCWLTDCEFSYSGPDYLDDSLWREIIRKGIISELAEKGITHIENNADLLIDFHVSVENETSQSYHYVDDQYEYPTFPLTNDETINYLKGTMIIHMVDREKGKMVWTAEAIGYMNSNPQLTEKNIKKGIKLTLKSFPPKE